MTEEAPKPVQFRTLVLIALAGWAVLAAFSIPYADRTLDDAWITFRYGRNLAEGAGLRWNVDDPRPFEAYTSTTHVLFAAAVEAVGGDPVLASKWLGVSMNLLLMLLLAVQVRHEGGGVPEMLLGALALGGSLVLAFHAVTGMETPVYAFLVSFATFALLRALRDIRWVPWLFVAFVLGFLTHPECALLFGIYFLLVGHAHRCRWRSLMAMTLFLLAIPMLLYAGFKWVYFGDLLPNSFRFKVTQPGNAFLPGLVYDRDFVLWTLPALAMWGLLLLARRSLSMPVLIALAALAIEVSFFLVVVPRVGVGFRFLAPFWPSIVLLLMSGMARWRVAEPALARRWVPILALLILANHIAFHVHWAPRIHRYMEPRRVNPALGMALAGLENPETITLVTGEAGAFPYYSRMRHLDVLGLVSEEGARSPFDPGWVFGHPVDLIITHSVVLREGPEGSFAADPELSARHLALQRNATDTLSYKLLAHPAMEHFALLARIPYRPLPRPHEYYVVLANRTGPRFDELARRMSAFTAPPLR